MHFLAAVVVMILSQSCYGNEIENKLIKSIDTIDNVESLNLIGGLTVDKINSARTFQTGTRNLPERVEQYLETHELNWQLPSNSEDAQISSQPFTGGRTRRLKKILLPLMLAMKLKLAIFLKLMIVFVKFLSLKALASSLLALLFTGSTMIKDFINNKKDHVATAYIGGTPLNTEVIHTDWSRNGQISAQDLAYGSYQSLPTKTL